MGLGGGDGDGDVDGDLCLLLPLPTCTTLDDPLLAEAVGEGALDPGVADLLPPLGDMLALLLASR